MLQQPAARTAAPRASVAARGIAPLPPPAAASTARRRAPAPRALPDLAGSAEGAAAFWPPARACLRAEATRCFRAALFAALAGGSRAARASAASAELLALLLPPGASSRGAAGDARVSALLSQLAATSVPFRASQLGGGPWQVVATAGALGWKPLAPGGAVAAQNFDVLSSRVVNSVSLSTPLGALRLTAEGDFSAVPDGADGKPSSSTPARFAARIRCGTLAVGSLRLPLPIAGEGSFEVAYVDKRLRVFRSATGLAVQVPQAAVAAAKHAAAKRASRV